MAQEIRQFSCTIPAGTAVASAQRFALAMPAREVEAVEIGVPPGVAGLVGYALQISRVTIIPYASDAFIPAYPGERRWDLSGYPNSGDWSLLAYNLGSNAHSLYVRFLLRLVAAPVTVTISPALTLADLDSATPDQVAALAAAEDATGSEVV